MSTKTIAWIVVALVVLGGIWWLWSGISAGTQPSPSTTQGEVPKGAAAPSPASGAQSGNAGAGGISAGGTSDAGLNAGLNTMDAQLQSASAGSNSAASFNDQPVQQTE